MQIPAFSIDISEEQRLRKLKTFNDTVIQTNDVYLHGLGYSEDFVGFVEQNLLQVNIVSNKFILMIVLIIEINVD
jgi:hypothetical protein